MIILEDAQNNTFELDRLWIPERMFNSEKNAGLERNEKTLQTYLIGDKGIKPDWIELRSRRHFKSSADKDSYLANLSNILDNVNRLIYEGLAVYVQFGYYFVNTQSNILDLDISIKLAATISDFKSFVPEDITWGRTDIRFDRTDITFG